jgi:hypothetical protein
MTSIKMIRHPVAALVLMAFFFTLFIQAYEGFQDSYGFNETDTRILEGETEEMNIMEALRSLRLIEGVAELQAGLTDLSPPAGSELDVLGGLASVAIGAIKSIVGVVTTPFEIVAIIVEYYTEIPSILTELLLIGVVYVGFILLSAYLRYDV